MSEAPGGAGTGSPMVLQAALNGARSKADHPAVPVSIDELVRDAAACVAAGAREVHLHPRDAAGLERLDAGVVDRVVAAVRGACGVPISVTTGAWIEPDVSRRLAAIRAWGAPDSASVNLGEPGAVEVMRALLGRGIGVEPGVSSIDEIDLLADSGLGNRCLRVLIEPVDLAPDDVLAVVVGIHAALDRRGIAVPRLQHGYEDTAWVVLADAFARGVATRIGLEDTGDGPGGDRVRSNEALVRAAWAVGAAA